jgi:hypothetical protein
MGSGGSFNRIYSRYTQTVAIPDRQGIAKARIIAEEKAKADPLDDGPVLSAQY